MYTNNPNFIHWLIRKTHSCSFLVQHGIADNLYIDNELLWLDNWASFVYSVNNRNAVFLKKLVDFYSSPECYYSKEMKHDYVLYRGAVAQILDKITFPLYNYRIIAELVRFFDIYPYDVSGHCIYQKLYVHFHQVNVLVRDYMPVKVLQQIIVSYL